MNKKHSTKLSITIRQVLVIIVTIFAIFSLAQPGNAGQCGFCQTRETNIKKEKIDMELLDHIAKLTMAGNEAFSEIRSIYENDERLRMPSDWGPLMEAKETKMNTAKQAKVIINGVDHYRVIEPLFECVRVVLSYRGENYSPAYIQGISGAAFRIAGICPCAPTCSSAMETQDLPKLLGYEVEHLTLSGEGIDPAKDVHKIVARVKDEIRAGRPAIVWHAFTNAEWDVVCGFDDEKKLFFGRGSYKGNEEYAFADETRTSKCLDICDSLGAILIGEKTGEFDVRDTELAALEEAVRHARTPKDRLLIEAEGRKVEWRFREGLACYDWWINSFKSDPERIRGAGDAYCFGVYRSTHRAASEFMRELAPKYPEATEYFECAAKHFAAEADVLDQGIDLLWWESTEGPDIERNARVAELLSQARKSYESGINEIEHVLKALNANKSDAKSEEQ